MMASNTVKIMTKAGIPLIYFNMPDEKYKELYHKDGEVIINVIGTCNANVWQGRTSPQILVKDYEIVNTCAYVF
jgi:hypothetical protein